ncbi:MAG: hypothetical protein Q9209_002219 [Squamulea sp. 1 TL-2023]
MPPSLSNPFRKTKITTQKLIEQLQKYSQDETHRCGASDFWIADKMDDEIYLFQNETKKYTLRPTHHALQHGNENKEFDQPGSSHFTIIADTKSRTFSLESCADELGSAGSISREAIVDTSHEAGFRTFSFKSTDEKGNTQLVEAVFVALGWLVEHNKDSYDKRTRTTNYVVLVNLATDPASVWLMFDYHMENYQEDLYRWTNRLGQYHHALFATSGEESGFQPVPDDFSNSRCCMERNEMQQWLKTNTNYVKPDDEDKTQTYNHGYLGLPPFDLALLATNIKQWTDKGFPGELVNENLHQCNIRFGSSLHAKRIQDSEHLRSLLNMDKRVQISHRQ